MPWVSRTIPETAAVGAAKPTPHTDESISAANPISFHLLGTVGITLCVHCLLRKWRGEIDPPGHSAPATSHRNPIRVTALPKNRAFVLKFDLKIDHGGDTCRAATRLPQFTVNLCVSEVCCLLIPSFTLMLTWYCPGCRLASGTVFSMVSWSALGLSLVLDS
jgi:hypothetical protein